VAREQIWLTILTAVIAFVTIGGVVTVAALRADLDLLDRELADLAALRSADGGTWVPGPENGRGQSKDVAAEPDSPSGRIQGVAVLSDTLTITVTLRYAGPGDLLYKPPLLKAAKATYHPTQRSLEQARFDLLSLVTGGEATAAFGFRPVPPQDEALTLIFNPNQQPGDPVAPHWEKVVRSEGTGRE
jgi:hypothetical protein